jgi:ribosomal protein S6--L-glutamate ligase
MNIAILSRKSSLYSTRRLREACEHRGHEVVVVDYLRCFLDITSSQPTIRYADRRLDDFDAVIPRIGASYTFYGTAVVRQFEMMGVFSTTNSDGISRSRDKLRAMQLLAGADVGMPVTSMAHSPKDTDGVIKAVGGAPLVIKLLEGTQGIGVVLAETEKAAQSVIEAFRGMDANILVQEFIEEAAGTDIRAFVVGNRVVAAMERRAAKGEFRSNLHRGGSAEPVVLTDDERETALRAAHTVGLDIAGVDMMRSNRGPLVLEVNSSPGLEGIEKSNDIDVADLIVQYIEENAEAS